MGRAPSHAVPSPSDDEIRRRYGLPPGTRIVRSRGPVGERVRLTPDGFHVREVESALDGAVWGRPVVVAGATVPLTVRGVAVGEGSPVRVTLRDARDRVVGRGESRMHRDRAVVPVEVDRRAAERDPDGALCAADVELPELGLKTVSAPLLVLPFAELQGARWGAAEARDGDVVSLSCRLSGSPAGVERAGREPAEVEVLRGPEGGDAGGDGLATAFEPVATFRVPVTDGRVEAEWRVGHEPEGKAQIATQPELDAAAERSGGAAGRYARPAWRFRVRLAGLAVESGELGYRDHVALAWDDETDRPAAGAPVEVRLADGSVRHEALGDDGRLRLDDVPPGPVEALFGPDPRVWERPAPPVAHGPTPPEDDVAVEVEPVGPVLFASVGADRALLAEAVGPDPEGGFVEWLWGTIKGDFDPDPEPSQIVATMAVGFVPVLGQLADLRDVIAGVYLLSTDGGHRDPWRWVGLAVTLVAFVPGVGDVLKGCFRFAVRGLRGGAGGLGRAAGELARAFAELGLGSPARWLDTVDLGAVSRTVRDGFEAATGKALGVFEGARSRLAASAERADGARVWVRNAFGLSPGEPSRLTRNVAATARALGDVVDDLRRVEAEALGQLDRVLDGLVDVVRRLVDRADVQWAAAGVDGRTITGITARPIRPLVVRMDEATGLDGLLGRRPGGGSGPGYTGRLRGEDVVLPGVPTESLTLTKRTRAEKAALRAEFDGSERSAFLKGLAKDPEAVEKLRAAGLTEDQIKLMEAGRGPGGNWQVHHKVPLDLGGTNDFDNLVIMQHEPFHKVITNAQRSLGLDVGGSATVDWPMPPGFIYPPNPIP